MHMAEWPAYYTTSSWRCIAGKLVMPFILPAIVCHCPLQDNRDAQGMGIRSHYMHLHLFAQVCVPA